MRVLLRAHRKKVRYIFRPGESKVLDFWDQVGMVALLYTAIFTPFEVAFLPGGGVRSFATLATWTEPRFLVNRSLDLYFILDLCAQFFISVRPRSHEDAARVETNSPTGAWIDDRRQIAKRYFMSGWVRTSSARLSILTWFPRRDAHAPPPL